MPRRGLRARARSSFAEFRPIVLLWNSSGLDKKGKWYRRSDDFLPLPKQGWDDSNDSYYLALYREKENLNRS